MDMYNLLNLKCGRQNGDYGVEIEVEGDYLPLFNRDIAKSWKKERDDSLRGNENAEYVMKKPLIKQEACDAIMNLDKFLKDGGAVVNESVRAGVHVHKNVQSYTSTELMTFSMVYYLLEDFIVHWAGPGRVGNHFCLRVTDAEDLVYKMITTCQKKDWRYVNTNDVRYASLNWNALHKYGSVEFRAMRSTAKFEDIARWVEIIDRVSEGAKKFNNPRDVISSISEFEYKERFIEYVMGDMANELLQFKDIDIWEAVETIQPLAFMIDWQKFAKAKINPFM